MGASWWIPDRFIDLVCVDCRMVFVARDRRSKRCNGCWTEHSRRISRDRTRRRLLAAQVGERKAEEPAVQVGEPVRPALRNDVETEA